MTTPRVWCRADVLVVLAAGAPQHLADGVAAVVGDDGCGLDDVLNALTADGLLATPSFVCAAPDRDGVRVVVRGEMSGTIVAVDGTHSAIDAGRASTWNDDVVADVSHIDLGDEDGAWLTWMVGASSPRSPERLARPAAPSPPVDPDANATLDEDAFHQLSEVEASPPDAPPGAPLSAAESQDDGGRSADDDATDFSGLLDPTSQLRAMKNAPAPAAAPMPAVEEPPEPPAQPEPAVDSGPDPEPPPPSPVPEAPSTATSTRMITAVPTPGGSVEAATPAAEMPPVPEPPLLPPPPSDEHDEHDEHDEDPELDEEQVVMTDTGLGEHDGLTITVADLARQARDPIPDTAATVRAVRCPLGHPNPVAVPTCRVCNQAISDRTATSIPRPVVARMVFDSGLIVDIDRPQLIGRRPTVAPDSGGELPNLVALPSPDGELSRQHVAVHLEGWDVLVEDLGSTNGTELQLPGQPAARLRSHEPTLATTGSSVQLAGTVRFQLTHPDH